MASSKENKEITFISPPHRGQINGSTSKTFLIIAAQPFDGSRGKGGISLRGFLAAFCRFVG